MKEEDTPSHWLFSGEKNESFARVRLFGNLGKLTNGEKLEMERVVVPTTVGNLLLELSKLFGIELRRESILVLVNGVEAGALQDLDTPVVSGDEVSLVPMFHGGEF